MTKYKTGDWAVVVKEARISLFKGDREEGCCTCSSCKDHYDRQGVPDHVQYIMRIALRIDGYHKYNL